MMLDDYMLGDSGQFSSYT